MGSAPARRHGQSCRGCSSPPGSSSGAAPPCGLSAPCDARRRGVPPGAGCAPRRGCLQDASLPTLRQGHACGGRSRPPRLERLGFVDAEAAWLAVDQQANTDVPARLRYDLHVLLVRHGRERCTCVSARCRGCPLEAACASAHQASGARADYIVELRRTPRQRARVAERGTAAAVFSGRSAVHAPRAT